MRSMIRFQDITRDLIGFVACDACKAVKVMVKGLRLAFEEGGEAGCDRDVIDNCHGLGLFSCSCTVEIC